MEVALLPSPVQPEKLRIGPERHDYVYTRIGPDVYRCSRNADRSDELPGSVLFLVMRGGLWEAVHAPVSASVEEARLGSPVFRTAEDATLAGDHEWEYWEEEQRAFRHLASFTTTLL